MNPVDRRNYYQVVIRAFNTGTASQFINVPFKATRLRVVSSNYNVDSADPSSETLYFVRSDLVGSDILSVLAWNQATSGMTFDINPNANVSGLYNFNIEDIGGIRVSLSGEWCVVLQFEN